MSSFTYQKSFVVIVTSNSPLTDLTEKWIADSIDISGSDITFTVRAGREEKLDKERLLQQVQTAIKQAFKNFE